MNPKLDRWESYTDETGRRHWRWPAIDRNAEQNPRAEAGPRQRIGEPQLREPQYSPMRLKGK